MKINYFYLLNLSFYLYLYLFYDCLLLNLQKEKVFSQIMDTKYCYKKTLTISMLQFESQFLEEYFQYSLSLKN